MCHGKLRMRGKVMMVRRIRALISDDRGTATLEFVIWFPVYIIMLVAVTDASVLYLTHTEMWNAARDSARLLSVGAMTATDVPYRAGEKLLLARRTYTVAASDADPVIVEISINVGDASVFGFFEPVLGRQLTARVEMMKEREPPAF